MFVFLAVLYLTVASLSALPSPPGWMMSRYGKKWTMVCLALPFLGGWVLILLASSAWMLDIGGQEEE